LLRERLGQLEFLSCGWKRVAKFSFRSNSPKTRRIIGTKRSKAGYRLRFTSEGAMIADREQYFPWVRVDSVPSMIQKRAITR
jgi:hypothetical protein